jgi:octaprenyl-diphosphate synthase
MSGMLHLGAAHQPISALLADQLQQVTLVFERQLASDMSAVNALCMHVEQYRGKMLRPTLVLLSGLAAGSHVRGQTCDAAILMEKHRIIAAVVEMIHMATLVHDDVLDEAEVRRRGSTVNALWGNEAAVILGDYLISNAFYLCSTAGDPAINLALGQVTNTLCEGELVQLHHRNNYSIDESTYIEIVARKTASLIGECCRLGAMISGASERTAMTLRRFGELLGIAFQIQDDLLDLVGDQDIMGKSLGKDLDKGKLTLPVIIHLDRAEQRERGEALLVIEQRDARELRRRLIDSGAVELTASKARQLVDEAKGELQKVNPGPARDLLADLAEAVISREF